jgi:hypothetical protein
MLALFMCIGAIALATMCINKFLAHKEKKDPGVMPQTDK